MNCSSVSGGYWQFHQSRIDHFIFVDMAFMVCKTNSTAKEWAQSWIQTDNRLSFNTVLEIMMKFFMVPTIFLGFIGNITVIWVIIKLSKKSVSCYKYLLSSLALSDLFYVMVVIRVESCTIQHSTAKKVLCCCCGCIGISFFFYCESAVLVWYRTCKKSDKFSILCLKNDVKLVLYLEFYKLYWS